jgi:hypothetical protein
VNAAALLLARKCANIGAEGVTCNIMQTENPTKHQIMSDLIAEQVDAQTAQRLADEVPEVCRRQLAYLDYQDAQDDRAATLIASIEGDWPEPSKSYWANVARQYDLDAASPQQDTTQLEAENSTESQGMQTSELYESNQSQATDVDAAVAALLAALETIATMQHAHRDVTTSSCPVCVAWDALKEWSHQQGLNRQASSDASL